MNDAIPDDDSDLVYSDQYASFEETMDYARQDNSDLYATLDETIDLARSNMLKAVIQVLLGALVIAFIVLLDHPTLGVFPDNVINNGYAKEIWVIKYIFIFGSIFYVAVALAYMWRALSHIREARKLQWGIHS